ncbi:MAG: replication initiator protein A, partial [Lachnospiraceae bacterium]|nr:replication initiator protein A [Lachnospiraceae bacterium]
MKFDYYYGSQADQFNFIKIPKIILLDKTFSSLSIQAKMLYGVLLDRMGLSMKNGWYDSENKVYIIYQIAEIQEDLGFSKKKAIDYLTELEVFGLVEKKRRGLGLPSILYVKSFLQQKDGAFGQLESSGNVFRSSDMGTSRVVAFDTSGSADLGTSGSAELTPQEVSKSTPLINNTKENNTEKSNYKSNHIVSADEKNRTENSDFDMKSVRDTYEEIIKE